MNSPHDAVEVRPKPVMKKTSVLDEVVSHVLPTPLMETKRNFDEREPARTPEDEQQDGCKPPESRRRPVVTGVAQARARRARKTPWAGSTSSVSAAEEIMPSPTRASGVRRSHMAHRQPSSSSR
jgi:hypothetical protein